MSNSRPLNLPLPSLYILCAAYDSVNSSDWFKTDRKLPIRQYYYKPLLVERLAEYDAQVGHTREYVREKAVQLYEIRRVSYRRLSFVGATDVQVDVQHTEDVLAFLSQERDKRWVVTLKIKDEREMMCALVFTHLYH